MQEKPNLSFIEQLSGGDKSFENRLLGGIKNELPKEIREYKNSLGQNKFLQTAENVHKLKHKISILGLEKSYQLAIDYEKDLKLQDLKLKNDFEKVLDSMIQFIDDC